MRAREYLNQMVQDRNNTEVSCIDAMKSLKDTYPSFSTYESLEKAIQADDVPLVSSIIQQDIYKSSTWMFLIPYVRSIDMGNVLMRKLSGIDTVSLQQHINVLNKVHKVIDSSHRSLDYILRHLTFDEIVQADRIDIFTSYFEDEYSSESNEFTPDQQKILNSIRNSKKELYDLSDKTIEWFKEQNIMEVIYHRISCNNPVRIPSGCLEREHTLMVYRTDADKVYKSLRHGMFPLVSNDESRYETYPYIHGKILEEVIFGKTFRPGNIKLNDILYADLHCIHIPLYQRFKSLLSIMRHISPCEDKLRAISIAVSTGLIDILDGNLNKGNVLSVISMCTSIHPLSIEYMHEKGLHPEWFLCYYLSDQIGKLPTDITIPQVAPNDIWKLYLANIIVYRRDNYFHILHTIMTLHKKDITPSIIENMYSLSKKHRDSQFNEILGLVIRSIMRS